MKPGWQTTEFWLNAGQQIVGLLVLCGFIAPQQATTVNEDIAKTILAISVLVVNVTALVHYVQGRIHLKSQQPPNDQPPGQGGVKGLFSAGALLLVVWLGGSSAMALEPAHAVEKCACPCGPACGCAGCECVTIQQAALLPWRSQIEQRLQKLENQSQSAPAPQAQPPIAIHQYHYYPPRQDLPIAGTPRQDLPIPGAPKQDLPMPGAPRQDVPIPGAPRQLMPPIGAPKQDLPPGGAPPQQIGPSRYTRYALYRRP
jgi:hypothetical protein